jgi:hypothetical protein
LIGNEAATQIQEVIKDALLGKTTFSIIAGSLTLYWCHYRFWEIQDSINMIWNLK